MGHGQGLEKNRYVGGSLARLAFRHTANHLVSGMYVFTQIVAWILSSVITKQTFDRMGALSMQSAFSRKTLCYTLRVRPNARFVTHKFFFVLLLLFWFF